jgi:chromosome segregation ATPase
LFFMPELKDETTELASLQEEISELPAPDEVEAEAEPAETEPEAETGDAEAEGNDAQAEEDIDAKAAALDLLKEADPDAYEELMAARAAKAEQVKATETLPQGAQDLDALASRNDISFQHELIGLNNEIRQLEVQLEGGRNAFRELRQELRELEESGETETKSYQRTYKQAYDLQEAIKKHEQHTDGRKGFREYAQLAKQMADTNKAFKAHMPDYFECLYKGLIKPGTDLDEQEAVLERHLQAKGKTLRPAPKLSKADLLKKTAAIKKKMGVSVGGAAPRSGAPGKASAKANGKSPASTGSPALDGVLAAWKD